MAVEAYKAGQPNGQNPVTPIMVDTVIEQGEPVWYCRHQVAWNDICTKAQLAANLTGRTQYLVAYPVGPHVTHYVTPDPAQHRAYGGHQPS